MVPLSAAPAALHRCRDSATAMILGAPMDVAHIAGERDVTLGIQSPALGRSPGLPNLAQESSLEQFGDERLCCRYTDGFQRGAKMPAR